MPIDPDKLYTPHDLVLQFQADQKAAHPDCAQVDLGGGTSPLDGLINVDLHAAKADIKLDLFSPGWGKKLKEQVGPISFAWSSHFVEHVPDWMAFFLELQEALIVGGVAAILTPYYTSIRATQDPTHLQMVSEARYSYLSREWRQRNSGTHYLPDVNFDFALAPIYLFAEEYRHITNQAIKDKHRKHTINAVEDILVFLRRAE